MGTSNMVKTQNTEPLTPDEALSYIGDMLKELSEMAEGADLGYMATLLNAAQTVAYHGLKNSD